MKHLFFFLFLALSSVVADAQVFTRKIVVDKFNDVISDKEQKTLISRVDSTLIVEEKGREPMTYVTSPFFYEKKGDEDNIVNLIDNVYGYEERWITVMEIHKPDDPTYYITHRVVTAPFSHRFESELWWILNAQSEGRTIYSRQ